MAADYLRLIRAYLSPPAAYLGAVALVIGGQARLTPRFTPKLYEKQRERTAAGMNDNYQGLGLSAGAMTTLTGITNILIAAACLWPTSRRYAGMAGLLYLTTGAYSRILHNTSMSPIIAMMVLMTLSALA